MATIREIRKRDDRVVPFDANKITDAIYKAIRSVSESDDLSNTTANDSSALEHSKELSAAVVHEDIGRYFGSDI